MLTKMDMAKVIVTALFDLPELVTEEKFPVAWRTAGRIARDKKEVVEDHYKKAHKILSER